MVDFRKFKIVFDSKGIDLFNEIDKINVDVPLNHLLSSKIKPNESLSFDVMKYYMKLGKKKVSTFNSLMDEKILDKNEMVNRIT